MTSAAPARALGSVERRIGYRFSRPELLRRALTHRSHAHEAALEESGDYERLEFLGDALLGFVVSERLFDDDPSADEGSLTRRKQSVVNTGILARAARRIGLGDEVFLGRGEEGSGGRDKASILADLFEAVLGAVFVDGGIRPARAFVRRHLGGELRETLHAMESAEDYKTRLQEWSQSRWRATPRYRILSQAGPAHELSFEVEVVVGEKAVARGTGPSRKQAEQNAAREALLRFDAEERRQ